MRFMRVSCDRAADFVTCFTPLNEGILDALNVASDGSFSEDGSDFPLAAFTAAAFFVIRTFGCSFADEFCFGLEFVFDFGLADAFFAGASVDPFALLSAVVRAASLDRGDLLGAFEGLCFTLPSFGLATLEGFELAPSVPCADFAFDGLDFFRRDGDTDLDRVSYFFAGWLGLVRPLALGLDFTPPRTTRTLRILLPFRGVDAPERGLSCGGCGRGSYVRLRSATSSLPLGDSLLGSRSLS